MNALLRSFPELVFAHLNIGKQTLDAIPKENYVNVPIAKLPVTHRAICLARFPFSEQPSRSGLFLMRHELTAGAVTLRFGVDARSFGTTLVFFSLYG
jgi:hypothetical protein